MGEAILMRFFLLLISLICLDAAGAAYFQSPNILKIANMQYTADGVIVLHCDHNVSASAGNCTFRKLGINAGYSPSGTGAMILGYRLTSGAAANFATGSIGCSSNDVGYRTTGTAPTYTKEFFKGVGTANIMLPGVFYRSLGRMTMQDEYAFPDSSTYGITCPSGGYISVVGSSSAVGEVGLQMWVREY